MIMVSCAVIVGILLGYFTKSYINFDISLLIQFGLYLLLGAMGYKIGSDDKLISNLYILGVKALIISVFAIVFSIIFVKLFYWRDKKW